MKIHSTVNLYFRLARFPAVIHAKHQKKKKRTQERNQAEGERKGKKKELYSLPSERVGKEEIGDRMDFEVNLAISLGRQIEHQYVPAKPKLPKVRAEGFRVHHLSYLYYLP